MRVAPTWGQQCSIQCGPQGVFHPSTQGCLLKPSQDCREFFARNCCSHARGNKNFSVPGKCDWASALQNWSHCAAWWFPLLTARKWIRLLLRGIVVKKKKKKEKYTFEDGRAVSRVIVLWRGSKTLLTSRFIVFAVLCIFIVHPWG